MARVHSNVMLLYLECGALVGYIFHRLLASTKDDHSPMMLAYVESIIFGILTEVNDLLLKFPASILSRSQYMSSSVSSIALIKKRVLEIRAFWVPFQQIISSIDEMMQIKGD